MYIMMFVLLFSFCKSLYFTCFYAYLLVFCFYDVSLYLINYYLIIYMFVVFYSFVFDYLLMYVC